MAAALLKLLHLASLVSCTDAIFSCLILLTMSRPLGYRLYGVRTGWTLGK